MLINWGMNEWGVTSKKAKLLLLQLSWLLRFQLELYEVKLFKGLRTCIHKNIWHR